MGREGEGETGRLQRRGGWGACLLCQSIGKHLFLPLEIFGILSWSREGKTASLAVCVASLLSQALYTAGDH